MFTNVFAKLWYFETKICEAIMSQISNKENMKSSKNEKLHLALSFLACMTGDTLYLVGTGMNR